MHVHHSSQYLAVLVHGLLESLSGYAYGIPVASNAVLVRRVRGAPVRPGPPILRHSTLPLPTAIDTQGCTGVIQETQVAGQEKGRRKGPACARGHDFSLFVNNLSTNLVPDRDARQTAQPAFYDKHGVSSGICALFYDPACIHDSELHVMGPKGADVETDVQHIGFAKPLCHLSVQSHPKGMNRLCHSRSAVSTDHVQGFVLTPG